jgi:hypothetical protein
MDLKEIESIGSSSQFPCFFVPSPVIHRIRNKELVLYD